jgi:hypothetical protein
MGDGALKRFCQKCSCWHALSAFRGAQRSCNKRLAIQRARVQEQRSAPGACRPPVVAKRAPAPVAPRPKALPKAPPAALAAAPKAPVCSSSWAPRSAMSELENLRFTTSAIVGDVCACEDDEVKLAVFVLTGTVRKGCRCWNVGETPLTLLY